MPALKVGFYIPCYNAEKTIGYCLDAVLKQTHRLQKIVVVDDASMDNTVAVASRYPVVVVRHKINKGLAAARNTGVRKINAEFVASLDADALPDPEWLARLMENFTSSRIAGVGGRLTEIYSCSVVDVWRSIHMKQYWDREVKQPPFLFGSNTVFRKNALIKCGLYNEKYKSNYEDIDISFRLKKKGWRLIYAPKALAYHLRVDNICSLLDTYWNWHFNYYLKKRYYSGLKNFVFKLKDNIGLANRYIEEDIAAGRQQLIYLDFLLGLHHSLKDFEHFASKDKQVNRGPIPFSSWLSLLDLTFFYHFDSSKNKIATLMPRDSVLLQNFFALNLILGKYILKRFKNNNFKKILYKHLLLSVYKLNDNYLLDRLLNLIELHEDWGSLYKKRQPNLNIGFLKNLSDNFRIWLDDLTYRFPDIVQKIEISAEKTDTLALP